MVQRVVAGRSHTLTKTLYSGSTPTDPSPDSAAATVTRWSDGTSFSPAVSDVGTGLFQFTLTPAQTATLDRLTVVWTATIGGQVQAFQDYVEVVGDVYFTIAEARAFGGLESAAKYSDDRIVAMRTTVEQALEDAIGEAFVPRYTKEPAVGVGQNRLNLDWRPVRAVRSVTASGVAYSPSQITALTFDNGYLYGSSLWPTYGNVTVGYEYGHDTPPDRLRRAALTLAKVWLVSGPVDDRATSFTSAESGGTYAMVVPGRGGSWVGVPEVDAVIGQYKPPLVA